jgi:ABC-type antimicrobial peptide transport system permease subunit
MKAVGASSGQVTAVFLAEAVVLSLTGGFIGIVSGVGLTQMLLKKGHEVVGMDADESAAEAEYRQEDDEQDSDTWQGLL